MDSTVAAFRWEAERKATEQRRKRDIIDNKFSFYSNFFLLLLETLFRAWRIEF